MNKNICKSVHLLIIAIAHFLISSSIFAQAPQKMSYQAVIRNSNDSLLISTPVGMRISLVQSSPTGTVVYSETQTPTTNANGLVSLQIGIGTAVSGTFASIDWAAGPYYVKTETDLNGGANYTITSSNELLSVPYALFSANGTPGETGAQGPQGIAGTNGVNGYNSIIKTSTELIGDNCIIGGIKLEFGLDYNYNAILDSMEINDSLTKYICNVVGILENVIVPDVQTISIQNISYNSASFSGNVISNGNKPFVARGFCVSTSPIPTEENGIVVSGFNTLDYSLTLENLHENTQYFVRAFSTNTGGTGYGQILTFFTLPNTIPLVETVEVTNITTSNAVAKGIILNDGGQEIYASGFCISETFNPTINDIVVSEFGNNTIIALLSGLNSNQLYHIRAYATNSLGTAYGMDISFSTLSVPVPSLVANNISYVSYNTAFVQGQITNLYNYNLISKGVCLSTEPNPTTSDTVFTNINSGLDISSNLSNLKPGVLYYVRCYLEYESGIVYSNELFFITLASSITSINTLAVTSIGPNTANSGGIVTSNGGSQITNKGICWSTFPNPTLSDFFSIAVGGSSSFNSVLTNLTVNTTYYIRAFAVNSTGTAYGNQISFATTNSPQNNSGLPIVGTSMVNKSISNYNGGGYVSSDGGSAIIQQGVCWNTSGSPSINDNVVVDDSTGQGFFSSLINIPNTCNVTYYIRAFATNSYGISYGNQVSIGSGLVSSFSTPVILNNNGNSALISSNILTDGGCPITQRGICWSVSPNPTLFRSSGTLNPFSVENGSGLGSFETLMSNLVPNTTYYVRSYAITLTGTYFSDQLTFTTSAANGLAIGEFYAGGIVFYIDQLGQHGLVCAASDIGYNPWGCIGACLNNQTEFGTGAQNTATIVSLCSQQNSAALVCDQYSVNGYSDWYLPSFDELKLIWQNLTLNGITGGLVLSDYWSSSDYGVDGGCANRAWSFNFGCECVNFWWLKGTNINTRAIRSF